MRRTGIAAAALAALLLLTGCTARPPAPGSTPTRATAGAPSPASPSPRLTGAPLTVAALGDSLSRGFDACARYGDCTEVSWSTGTDPRVDSVADRLSRLREAPVTRVNAARSGAESDDLDRQVTAVLPRDPDLVTLLIGANDVCRSSVDEMTPTTVYADRVVPALDRLSSGLPSATLLVSSVPDVTALLPAAKDDSTARFIWSRLGGCATVLDDPRSTSIDAELRRQAVRSRIAEYGTALRLACAQHPRCVYDGGALQEYRPELAQLSALDYFHPSVAGLTEVAALQWRALEDSGLLPAG